MTHFTENNTFVYVAVLLPAKGKLGGQGYGDARQKPFPGCGRTEQTGLELWISDKSKKMERMYWVVIYNGFSNFAKT